jgi:hypothetical protein
MNTFAENDNKYSYRDLDGLIEQRESRERRKTRLEDIVRDSKNSVNEQFRKFIIDQVALMV